MTLNCSFLILSIIIAFITTYVMTPVFIRFMHATGIVGTDIMKSKKVMVADMGGPAVISGFLLGIFSYIGLELTSSNGLPDLINILATLNTILIITLIGIFDVLTSKMKEREGRDIFERLKRRGIPPWAYYFIPMAAAVPLMAVNIGTSYLSLPFIGKIDFGIFYPLILVPLAVLCCSNATNFLAGFNGLEAGMGFVLLFSLGIFSIFHERFSAASLSLIFAFALLAFLKYNWYPARVFPGDLNHTIGALVACIAIIGNIEKFAILCFIPYIIEAVLKSLSLFKSENFGILKPNGTLRPKETKIRSLTHIIMSLGAFKEWQVTIILIFIEIFICIISFLLIRFI
ncbi:hypothetical protein JW865_01345 [Candidatus Bathyarchaeota archaeon]|nr:hypothetical protein [Candidatus Bathyarchaeota archaeon]